MSNEVRPYSAAWYQMQQRQAKTYGENPTSTGFPDAVASTGLKIYDQTSSYPEGVLVFRGGSLFRSNSFIPANTAFSEGPGAEQWTNVSQSKTELPIWNSSDVYNTNEPASRNGIIYRCKEDNVTGPWTKSKWEMVSQPPARVFFDSTDSNTLVTEGFKAQEIIFEVDRVIGEFQFFDGDRIILRRDLNGAMVAADFYYFPVTTSEQPQPAPDDEDIIRTLTVLPTATSVIFYPIDPGMDVTVNQNEAGQYTWDDTTAVDPAYAVTKIRWFRDDEGTWTDLVLGDDFEVDAVNKLVFRLTGSRGAERDDILQVTLSK